MMRTMSELQPSEMPETLGVIAGLGALGYELALEAAASALAEAGAPPSSHPQ